MRKQLILTSTAMLLLTACDQSSNKVDSKTKVNTDHKKSVTKPVVPTDAKVSSKPEHSVRVSVLDFNKVWHDAQAPQQIRKAIQAKRRQYQREVIKLEEKLRRQEEELQKQHENESAETYQKRRKAFEDEVLRVQKQVKSHKDKLEKDYLLAMKRVNHQLNQIVKKIATERQLDLILPQTQVAFNHEALNITEEVIEELDTTLPTVNIKS